MLSKKGNDYVLSMDNKQQTADAVQKGAKWLLQQWYNCTVDKKQDEDQSN